MKAFTKRLSIKVLAVLLMGVLSLGGLFLHNGVKIAAAETTESVKTTDLLDTTATVTQDENGLRLSSDDAYTATFAGTFQGDTKLKFTFPETYTDAFYGDLKFRITDATDDSNYFDIIYYVENNSLFLTAAYVQYGKEIRMSSDAGAWYNSKTSGLQNFKFAPCFLNKTSANYPDRVGILSLVWDGDVLSVSVNSGKTKTSDSMVKIAGFDGTSGFAAGKSWGLPKINFANGYKITVSSEITTDNPKNDKGTDVCFKEIAEVDMSASTLNSTYKYRMTFENATVVGNDVYIPQNEEIGEIKIVYTHAYGDGSWKTNETFDITKTPDVSTVGEQSFTVTDDNWKKTPLGEITSTYTVHVETPYTLTFDVDGGEAIEKIVHSENTTDRITVSDAVKMFWVFDGWYIGSEKWSGKISELCGKDVTLTAHWLDVEAPTIWLDGVNDVTYEAKGTTVTVGKADVAAGDDAQNKNIVVTLALKKPNETEFKAIADAYELTLDASGSYIIKYTVADSAGYTATCERTIEVFERNAPTLTVEEGYKTQAGPGLNVEFATVTAKNADGEDLEVAVSVVKDGVLIETEGTSFVPTEMGEYTVTFYTVDKAPYDKLQSIYSYTVVVLQDDVAPVIGNEFTDMTVKLNTTVTIPTITATDNISENVLVEVFVYYGTQKIELTNNSFKAEQEGSYRVLLIAQDEAGNSTQKMVYVTVTTDAGKGGGCGCSGSGASGGLGLPMGLLMIAGGFVFGKNIMMKKMKRKENI